MQQNVLLCHNFSIIKNFKYFIRITLDKALLNKKNMIFIPTQLKELPQVLPTEQNTATTVISTCVLRPHDRSSYASQWKSSVEI